MTPVGTGKPPPTGAAALGCIAVLAGLLLSAWYANEWMKLSIEGNPPFTLDTQPPPACEADELEEENLSLAECAQMAVAVHTVSLSSADWFPPYHAAIGAAGALIALLSVASGIALIDYRRWAPSAAVTCFAALFVVDVLLFIGVVGTGPLIRQTYLSLLLLLIALHLALTVAAAACRQAAISPDTIRAR